jgi:hypothetical protein
VLCKLSFLRDKIKCDLFSFAFFLLFLKPVMLLFLNKVRQDRLGENTSPTFGGWGSSNPTPGKIYFSIILINPFICLLVPGYTPVDEPAA